MPHVPPPLRVYINTWVCVGSIHAFSLKSHPQYYMMSARARTNALMHLMIYKYEKEMKCVEIKYLRPFIPCVCYSILNVIYTVRRLTVYSTYINDMVFVYLSYCSVVYMHSSAPRTFANS